MDDVVFDSCAQLVFNGYNSLKVTNSNFINNTSTLCGGCFNIGVKYIFFYL